MNETADRAIDELKRKGCAVLDKCIFVPVDHGCGNKSFGRIDHLVRKEKFTVYYLRISDKRLSDIVRKLSTTMTEPDTMRRLIINAKERGNI